MKLFITGGAGFIGSGFVHVIDAEKPDWSSVIYDKLTYAGRKENLADVLASARRDGSERHQLVVGDICDAEAVAQAMQDCDMVIHFAAESHVTRSEDDPDRFYKTNVEGTRVVLEAAKQLGIPTIHISTDEVYGPITDGYFKESDKLAGDSQATSPYAKSKAQADEVAQEFARGGPAPVTGTGQSKVIIVRPTNNYGPRQYPEKALPRWITNIIDGADIPLWGEGQQVRDWLFVEDTAHALLAIIDKGTWGETYNIGANHSPEIPNRLAAEMVCDDLGVGYERIKHIPDPRPDHDVRYGVETSKLEALGYKPDTSFASGLKTTVDWYVSNEAWWRSIKAEAESIYTKKEQK